MMAWGSMSRHFCFWDLGSVRGRCDRVGLVHPVVMAVKGRAARSWTPFEIGDSTELEPARYVWPEQGHVSSRISREI